jgi:hypothetical protein
LVGRDAVIRPGAGSILDRTPLIKDDLEDARYRLQLRQWLGIYRGVLGCCYVALGR